MVFTRASILRWLPWILLMAGLVAFWKWQNITPPVTYITGTITRGTLEDSVTATRVLEAKALDRKSTRLDFSHLVISYAVFYSKKQNIEN